MPEPVRYAAPQLDLGEHPNREGDSRWGFSVSAMSGAIGVDVEIHVHRPYKPTRRNPGTVSGTASLPIEFESVREAITSFDLDFFDEIKDEIERKIGTSISWSGSPVQGAADFSVMHKPALPTPDGAEYAEPTVKYSLSAMERRLLTRGGSPAPEPGRVWITAEVSRVDSEDGSVPRWQGTAFARAARSLVRKGLAEMVSDSGGIVMISVPESMLDFTEGTTPRGPVTFDKERRGDGYISWFARRDGILAGSMMVAWSNPGSGRAFENNFHTSDPRVRVKVIHRDGQEVVIHEKRLEGVKLQRDAYRAGRAYLRSIDAKGMIIRAQKD